MRLSVIIIFASNLVNKSSASIRWYAN